MLQKTTSLVPSAITAGAPVAMSGVIASGQSGATAQRGVDEDYKALISEEPLHGGSLASGLSVSPTGGRAAPATESDSDMEQQKMIWVDR